MNTHTKHRAHEHQQYFVMIKLQYIPSEHSYAGQKK